MSPFYIFFVVVVFSQFVSFQYGSYKKPLVLALGDCIPVRPWSDSPIACIAELRMVWRDKNEQCLLASLRLYFLPENTPMGRNCHGEVSVDLMVFIFIICFDCVNEFETVEFRFRASREFVVFFSGSSVRSSIC